MIATAAHSHSGWMTIKEVSDRLGLSPALMRLWESRYGWPSPRRTASGQRRFSPGDVEEIRQVQAQIQAGRAIGSLIIDGRPELPAAPARPRIPLADTVLAAVPLPQRPLAQGLRAELVESLRQRDASGAERVLHQALRDCSPADRARAVWLPTLALLAAWDESGSPLPGADALRALIRAQGGPERCPVQAAMAGAGIDGQAA